jgi:hypothetical protein
MAVIPIALRAEGPKSMAKAPRSVTPLGRLLVMGPGSP